MGTRGAVGLLSRGVDGRRSPPRLVVWLWVGPDWLWVGSTRYLLEPILLWRLHGDLVLGFTDLP